MAKGKERVASISEQPAIPDSGRLGEVVQWGIIPPRSPNDEPQIVIIANLDGASIAQEPFVVFVEAGKREITRIMKETGLNIEKFP